MKANTVVLTKVRKGCYRVEGAGPTLEFPSFLAAEIESEERVARAYAIDRTLLAIETRY